ncbi:hypothetical protein ACLOJK_012277 [Asimina triloba]
MAASAWLRCLARRRWERRVGEEMVVAASAWLRCLARRRWERRVGEEMVVAASLAAAGREDSRSGYPR